MTAFLLILVALSMLPFILGIIRFVQRQQHIERRLQDSNPRLRKPSLRLVRPLATARADSRDDAIVKEAQVQILQDFGREMRQAS